MIESRMLLIFAFPMRKNNVCSFYSIFDQLICPHRVSLKLAPPIYKSSGLSSYFPVPHRDKKDY